MLNTIEADHQARCTCSEYTGPKTSKVFDFINHGVYEFSKCCILCVREKVTLKLHSKIVFEDITHKEKPHNTQMQ